MFGWFLHALHHQHQQHHVTTQNTSKQLVLAWILSCFLTCWKKHVQWVMLAKAFPRLVGRVKLDWTLCEFWWWKVQLEYGYVWTVFTTHFTTSTTTTNTSSTRQPHRIPANNLHNAIFTMVVLAWILSCFKTCWKKQVQCYGVRDPAVRDGSTANNISLLTYSNCKCS